MLISLFQRKRNVIVDACISVGLPILVMILRESLEHNVYYTRLTPSFS